MNEMRRSVPGGATGTVGARASTRTRQDGPLETDLKSALQSVPKRQKVGHWLMMACCAAMVTGVALLLVAEPETLTAAQLLRTTAPLLACLGMHFILHKIIGHAGHSKPSEKDLNQ